MKISVQIDVPDREFCHGCDLWWRSEFKSCYCLLFGMVELEGRYRKNTVTGMDILKCEQCKASARTEANS